jgi:AraC-like DNA-binding protein
VTSPLLQEHQLSPATVNGGVWRFSWEYPKLYHFHGQLEFLLVKRGFVRERVGNRIHVAHAGQLLWHLPGRPHENVGGAPDLDLRVVHLEPDLFPDLAGLSNLVAGRPVIELQRADFYRLLDQCDCPSDASGSLADRTPQIVAAARVALAATRTDHEFTRATSLVELACNLMVAQPSIARPALCRALDVSTGFLSRCFQRELGLALQDQRAHIRVALFVTRVVRDRQGFLRAALDAGFGSYSQLHRVFVRVAGVTPREYFGGGRNVRAEMKPAEHQMRRPEW